MNHPRLVQSLAWLAFLALVILGGHSSSYIASWQGDIMLVALGLFTVLLILDLLFGGYPDTHDHAGHEHHDHGHAGHDHVLDPSQPDQRSWLQTGVHLLPLCLLLTMGTTTLGSQSLRTLRHPQPRALAGHAWHDLLPASGATALPTAHAPVPVVSTKTGQSEPVQAVRPPARVEMAVNAPGAGQGHEPIAIAPGPVLNPATRKPAATPLNLLDLYYPTEHPGVVRVEVIGRLSIPTPAMLKDLPPGVEPADAKLFLYRFLVTCCAADAQPVLVVLKNAPDHGVTVDAWVRVTGRWVPPKELGDISGIVVEDMQPIPAPSDPYLHPVWR